MHALGLSEARVPKDPQTYTQRLWSMCFLEGPQEPWMQSRAVIFEAEVQNLISLTPRKGRGRRHLHPGSVLMTRHQLAQRPILEGKGSLTLHSRGGRVQY